MNKLTELIIEEFEQHELSKDLALRLLSWGEKPFLSYLSHKYCKYKNRKITEALTDLANVLEVEKSRVFYAYFNSVYLTRSDVNSDIAYDFIKGHINLHYPSKGLWSIIFPFIYKQTRNLVLEDLISKGWPYASIAEHLGISISYVYKIHSNGKKASISSTGQSTKQAKNFD